MILHIVLDEKFIDMAYNIFEKVSPKNNEFMVITDENKFKYIKTTPITKITKSEFLSRSFAKSLDKYEFIVIHLLNENTKKIILNAHKNIKFLWIGWGFDYYGYVEKKLFLPKTNKLSKTLSHDSFTKKILKTLKLKYKNLNDKKRVLNRINYFAPVLYEDYQLVEGAIKNFEPKYLDWNYGTLEDDLIKEEDIKISGNNILLGNSASFENNHLEAIDMLKKLDLKNKKIISPLSYGDMTYASEIKEYGIKQLGESFEPLTTFMNLDEYNKLISTCSIVIMNHLRQQALGNIVLMMYFGAKIFLNKENPIYDFFIHNQAIIFPMEKLNNKNIRTRLTTKEIEINRIVLRKYWSREVMSNKTRNLIKIMKENM